MEVARFSRQPLSEVRSWVDEDLVTMLDVLRLEAAAIEERSR